MENGGKMNDQMEEKVKGESHEDLYATDEEFRDSIATVDEEGKRIWIYPKKPSGRFHGWRIAVTVILLSILFA
ncbi:MAG: hypothetical protein OEV24_21605, partial [Cyclobacteriaceae bacterium]|nr:hypothetical protein [Cyclobacteriaceae bacterium]